MKVVIMLVLLAFAVVLFLGSVGAFLLYVPVLSIAAAVSALVGLVLMFWLGFQAGTQSMLSSESLGTSVPGLASAPALFQIDQNGNAVEINHTHIGKRI